MSIVYKILCVIMDSSSGARQTSRSVKLTANVLQPWVGQPKSEGRNTIQTVVMPIMDLSCSACVLIGKWSDCSRCTMSYLLARKSDSHA